MGLLYVTLNLWADQKLYFCTSKNVYTSITRFKCCCLKTQTIDKWIVSKCRPDKIIGKGLSKLDSISTVEREHHPLKCIFLAKLHKRTIKLKMSCLWALVWPTNLCFKFQPRAFTGNQKVSKFVCDLVELGITLQDSANKTWFNESI